MAKRKLNAWPPKGRQLNYAFVTELREAIRESTRQTRLAMETAEDVYVGELSLGINLPKGIPIHKPSTASSRVDSAAAHLITEYPQVKIRPSGNPGKRNQARDERLLKGINYFFRRLREEHTEEVIEPAKHDIVRLGSGCIKFVFDEDEWPPAPEQSSQAERENWLREREQSFPFYLRALDPKTVYVSPNGTWPHSFVIEEQERFALDLWVRYPNWRAKNENGDPQRRVEWLEYWDVDNYIAFADGVQVFRRHNIHHVVPYIYITVQRRQRTQGQGMLAGPVVSELEAEARIKTAMDALWQQVVFPRVLAKKEEVRQIRTAWNMGPGGVIPVDQLDGDNRSIMWLDMPQLNSAMFSFLPLISDAIRTATFDEALLGQRPTGVDFAAHQALLIGQSRQSLRPYLNALNRLATSLANMFLMYVENVLVAPMNVGGRDTIKPADINGNYNAQVSFEPVSKEDDDRRSALGIQILGSKALPWKVVLEEYFKRDDAFEIMIQTWAEQVIFQLISTGLVSQAVLQTANLEEAEEQLQGDITAAAQQVRGTLPRFGGAGEPVGELSNRLTVGQQAAPNIGRGDEPL